MFFTIRLAYTEKCARRTERMDQQNNKNAYVLTRAIIVELKCNTLFLLYVNCNIARSLCLMRTITELYKKNRNSEVYVEEATNILLRERKEN